MTPQEAKPVHLVFSSSLQIGLPEVDRQHAALIQEFNRLIDDAQALPSTERFTEVLSRLGSQLGDHFRFEEGLFAGLGMGPDEIDEHVAAHLEIVSQYVELNLDLMTHLRSHTRAEVLGQVQHWVADHIAAYDLKMRDHLPA
jgi:hemerythrin